MTLKHYVRFNAFQIFLGIAITGLWIYFTGGTRYLGSFRDIRPDYIILLLGIISFCIFSRFVRWQFILRRIDVRIPARRSLSIYMASLVGIATPAYLGEIIRGLFIRREFRVPFLITLWVFVVERLLDLCALGIIGMFTAQTWEMKKAMALILAVILPIGFFSAMIVKSMGVSRSAIKKLGNGTVLLQCVAISLIAWIPATLLLSIAAAGLGAYIDFINAMEIFSTSTVLGSITLIPPSVSTTGNIAIQRMINLDIHLNQSVHVVSIVLLMSASVTLLIGAVFLLIELKVKRNDATNGSTSHFDEITPEYKDQFASHVWDHLVEKKIALMDAALENTSSKKGTGLDLGCGLGQQCLAMSQRGYSIVGLDYSYKLAQKAHLEGVKVVNGDALTLPFRESSFKYVYTIGALHHIPGVTDQESAYREIARVLKPGGYLIVHESNTRNPLFRFYMGYIFPLIRTIDEGTEWWMEPQRWEKIEGMKLCFVRYFTFIPDFIPKFLMRPLLTFERILESGRLRFYSVHYMAVLQKPLKACTIPD